MALAIARTQHPVTTEEFFSRDRDNATLSEPCDLRPEDSFVTAADWMVREPSSYYADIAEQLNLAAKMSGRPGRKPAYLLKEILDLHGYHVEEADLGLDCSYVVDFERKLVSLARGLGKEQRFLKLARCISAIRLGDVNAGLPGPEAARRADLYTRLLLIPEARLHECLANLTTVYGRGHLLMTVAAHFSVPKHIVAARLQELKERAA